MYQGGIVGLNDVVHNVQYLSIQKRKRQLETFTISVWCCIRLRYIPPFQLPFASALWRLYYDFYDAKRHQALITKNGGWRKNVWLVSGEVQSILRFAFVFRRLQIWSDCSMHAASDGPPQHCSEPAGEWIRLMALQYRHHTTRYLGPPLEN
jgi:hypothetical protein